MLYCICIGLVELSVIVHVLRIIPVKVNDEHTLLMKTIAGIENCNVKEMRFNFSCKMKSIFVFNDIISISLRAIKYVVYTELKLYQRLEEIFVPWNCRNSSGLYYRS